MSEAKEMWDLKWELVYWGGDNRDDGEREGCNEVRKRPRTSKEYGREGIGGGADVLIAAERLTQVT
jgi:hypothetical protein